MKTETLARVIAEEFAFYYLTKNPNSKSLENVVLAMRKAFSPAEWEALTHYKRYGTFLNYK